MVPYPQPDPGKPRLVLVGGGWGAFYIAEKIDYNKYTVTMISPRRTSAYTPLLASAAVGLFGFSQAEEQIRSKSRKQLRFLKANVTDVDFASKQCTCVPAFDEDPDISKHEFKVEFDMLVLAPGCESNTFRTPGVYEHAIFVKNVSDAMKIRKKLFDLLEIASLPHISRDRAKELLHIAIIGGGPTGIELTAEIGDLARNELQDLYPHVADLVSISVYDVAPNILGAYHASLHKYATEKLARNKVAVATNTHIERVDDQALYTKEHGRVPYGMLLWATGNKNVALIDKIAPHVRLPDKGLKRILTDTHLRVYKNLSSPSPSSASGNHDSSEEIWDGVFALGDAADITHPTEHHSLPTTAEAAVQKAKYLVEQFNSIDDLMAQPFSRPFTYTDKQMVSYIGSHDGVITGQKSKKGTEAGVDQGYTGQTAWLAWRRGSLYWNRSWRSRVAIVVSWALNWMFGKEIAKL